MSQGLFLTKGIVHVTGALLVAIGVVHVTMASWHEGGSACVPGPAATSPSNRCKFVRRFMLLDRVRLLRIHI